MVRLQSIRVNVGTTVPSLLFSAKVRDFQSVMFKAIGALEWGIASVTIGTGMAISAGEYVTMSHLDFQRDDREVQESMLDVYAIAVVATTCHVTRLVR